MRYFIMYVMFSAYYEISKFDYKKFFDSATDPQAKASIIAGNFAKVAVGIALIFIVIGIINAIIN